MTYLKKYSSIYSIMSLERTVDLIRGAKVDVDSAGQYAPVRDGVLDQVSKRVIRLTEDDYNELIYASWQRLIHEDDSSAATLSKLFGNSEGIYASTGYLVSIDLLSHGESSVRMYSASGRVEPENPIQLATGLYAEQGFCIAGLAILKALRQMAYINRPGKIHHFNPVRWAESYGRQPFTLGWHTTEEHVLLGAAGFTPSLDLLTELSQYNLTSLRLFKAQDEYWEFIGSGMADQTFVNGCQTIDQAIVLANSLAVQGANLNL